MTSYGIAWGVGHAHLSYPARLLLLRLNKIYKSSVAGFLLALLECPGCLGFWLGVLAYAFNYAPSGMFSSWWQAGFATAASNLVLYKLTGLADSAALEGSGAHDDERGPGENR